MPASESILYAGYGANRDTAMMEAIIGARPKILGSVAIKDVELCVQRHDQITGRVLASAPAPLSPKQVIAGAWGEGSDFETYAIRLRQGSRVGATLFELTTLQRELVAEWELVPFGWYDRMGVSLELADNTELWAETEGFISGQDVDRVVDGQDYATFLADRSTILGVAARARQEYFERLEQQSGQ